MHGKRRLRAVMVMPLAAIGWSLLLPPLQADAHSRPELGTTRCLDTSQTLASFSKVRPPVTSQEQVEPDLMKDLIKWIGKNTDYKISTALSPLPTISFCHQGDSVPGVDQRIIVEPPVVGVYDASKRRIYLVRPWNSQNIRHVGRLLHELVHDVQLLNRQWSCWGDAEWEAYKLVEAWLKERGTPSNFNWFQIYMQSRCRPDVHP